MRVGSSLTTPKKRPQLEIIPQLIKQSIPLCDTVLVPVKRSSLVATHFLVAAYLPAVTRSFIAIELPAATHRNQVSLTS